MKRPRSRRQHYDVPSRLDPLRLRGETGGGHGVSTGIGPAVHSTSTWLAFRKSRITCDAHGEKVCITSVTRGPRLTRTAGLRAGPGKKLVDLRAEYATLAGGSAVLCSVLRAPPEYEVLRVQ